MAQIRWFQKVASGVLILFLSIIVLVIVIAYTRRSGATGIDMAKVQLIRYEANRNNTGIQKTEDRIRELGVRSQESEDAARTRSPVF